MFCCNLRILPWASAIWHDEACRRLLSTTGLVGYVSQLTKKYGGQFSRRSVQAIDWTTEEWQFHYSQEQDIFLLSNVQTGCRTFPSSNQWVTGTLYPVVRRPGAKMTVHFHPVPRLQVHVHLTSGRPYGHPYRIF
jgi:hypothetical protein